MSKIVENEFCGTLCVLQPGLPATLGGYGWPHGFYFAHHMHLGGLAVKALGEFFFAVDELQRFIIALALNARHILGLLGAQV